MPWLNSLYNTKCILKNTLYEIILHYMYIDNMTITDYNNKI